MGVLHRQDKHLAAKSGCEEHLRQRLTHARLGQTQRQAVGRASRLSAGGHGERRPHRHPVVEPRDQRDHHPARLHPGHERRQAVHLPQRGGEQKRRCADRLLRLLQGDLCQRLFFLSQGVRSAGLHEQAGAVQGRRRPVREATRRRPQQLGRLQRRAGRSQQRHRHVDHPDVRRDAQHRAEKHPGRQARPMGNVVGLHGVPAGRPAGGHAAAG